MKITQSSKDIVLDSYQPYNRYSDPHLAKYLGRKTKIAQNKKDAIKKDEYYANGMQNKGYPILDSASLGSHTPTRHKGQKALLAPTPMSYKQRSDRLGDGNPLTRSVEGLHRYQQQDRFDAQSQLADQRHYESMSAIGGVDDGDNLFNDSSSVAAPGGHGSLLHHPSSSSDLNGLMLPRPRSLNNQLYVIGSQNNQNHQQHRQQQMQ